MTFNSLVVTCHTVGVYDILIIQEPDGELLTLKIEEYEPERAEPPKHFYDDQNIH